MASENTNVLRPLNIPLGRKKRKLDVLSPLRCIDANIIDKNVTITPLIKKCRAKERKSPPAKKIAKKKLNFSPFKPFLPPPSILDETANLEAPAINKDSDANLIAIDWSLKTALRFTFDKSVPFKGYFTPSGSALGSTAFSRCQSQLDLEFEPALAKNCFVYRAPHIPGYDLFPRINDRCKMAQVSKTVSECLFKEYCVSLNHLFELTTTRHCAYFYLCAQQFTVLFRAAGVGGLDEIHAIVNPTSENFRQKLREERITFSMPLFEKEAEKDQSISLLDDDEDASSFLIESGIDPQKILSQKPKRKTATKPATQKASLVMVKGFDVKDLISFLLKPTIILAKTGSLANIPPTILSPVNFKNCFTDFFHPKLKKISEESVSVYSLEIKGPILPHIVHNLCELFRKNLTEFMLESPIYDLSSPLTAFHASITPQTLDTKSIFALENLKDCGFPDKFSQKLASLKHQSCVSIDSIIFKEGKYNYNR